MYFEKLLKTAMSKKSNLLKFLKTYKPHVHAWLSQWQMKNIQNNAKNIQRGDILAFVCLKDEAARIPYFLEYYRNRGVGHFLFVDNDSSDGFFDQVKNQQDCSVWKTTTSYKNANFGLHWVNTLLRRYGTGHWCLTIDPDEFLVHPHGDARSLKDLIEFLGSEQIKCLHTIMLDCYSDKPIAATNYAPGDDIFAAAPYFDPVGYVQTGKRKTGGVFVQGGPRMREMFADNPEQAPALNKTPLVFWKRHYAYVSSTHTINIKALNNRTMAERGHPSAVLMHYKFLHLLSTKASDPDVLKEHYMGGREYKKYDEKMGLSLYVPGISTRYKNAEQLCELGLMARGYWL